MVCGQIQPQNIRPNAMVNNTIQTTKTSDASINRKMSCGLRRNGMVTFIRISNKWAVQHMSQKITELLAVNNLQLADLDWIILHSANLRIIEAVAFSINYPMDRMLTSLELFGNTSSASIPLAWDLAARAGTLKKGDKALLLGFGGGLTYAGVIVEV